MPHPNEEDKDRDIGITLIIGAGIIMVVLAALVFAYFRRYGLSIAF